MTCSTTARPTPVPFTAEARAFFDAVGCPTLEKPFDKSGLLAVIDGLLA